MLMLVGTEHIGTSVSRGMGSDSLVGMRLLSQSANYCNVALRGGRHQILQQGSEQSICDAISNENEREEKEPTLKGRKKTWL
jgi:hypothetical protein